MIFAPLEYWSGLDVILVPGQHVKMWGPAFDEHEYLEWQESHPWWTAWLRSRCNWLDARKGKE